MQLKQAVDSAYQLFIENDVPSPRLNAELRKTLGLTKASAEAEAPAPVVPAAAENGKAASRRSQA